MLTAIKNDAKTIREVVIELKEEIRKIAMGEPINHTALESLRGVIVFYDLRNHTALLEDGLKGKEEYEVFLEKIERWYRLSGNYYTYFAHYWHCYEEGDIGVREDLVSYGESYVIAMLEGLNLEYKLFDLTTRESIVQ